MSTVVVTGAVIAAAIAATWRGSPVRKAALYGTVAALTWCATFIKATTDTLASFGVFGMFLHWPVYALAVTGLALCSSRRRCMGAR